ncbi:MAG TPA: hypothetical protein VH308_00710 [Terracidiphilus sp.]|nr:hypothetical protein [Terracidiphilus sp.]
MNLSLDRRNFVRLCSAFALSLSPAAFAQTRPAPGSGRTAVKNRKNLVGIQVRGFSWVDEGVDAVLDNLQQKGDVNTLFAYTFSYGEARLRKDGPIPLPDHGKPGDSIAGGTFYDYDPKYFQNTVLKDFRYTGYGNFNVIEAVAPKAHARGMDFFAWDLNNAGAGLNRTIPNYVDVSEIDVYGRRTAGPCFNNPDYRAFLSGKVQSLLLGYPDLVDGIAWGSERMGPFENLVDRMVPACCFCQFCQAKAREREISIVRAQEGYRQLEQLFRSEAAGQEPTDGSFVTFWRLLLRYPEILSWQTLWTDSYQELEAQLYGEAKAIAPEKPFGFHIMQSFTFSPFYRAEEDYKKRANFADFLKPATYNNAGGPRMAAYLKRLSQTIFHDAKPEDFLQFYYKIMDDPQAPYDQLATAGLTADYVARETKRAVEEVAGKVKIYPGIDIDVPTLTTAKNPEKRTSPDDVKKALHAAFDAKADGVILCREYAEMWLANLSAAGDTLREIFAQQPKS